MVNRSKGFFRLFDIFRRPALDLEKRIISPDGRVILKVYLKQGHISYSIYKDNKTMVKNSRLGMKIKNSEPLGDHLSVVRMTERNVDTKFETVWGEDRIIRNNYRELSVYLSEIRVK